MKQHDIILLQEHWLYSFEKPHLETIVEAEGWGVAVKSVDDDDPIGPQSRPRGKGGVATLWSKKLNSHINILQDGNERILAIEVGQQVLLVNTYMPARGTVGAEMEFDGCLAELEEITTKFSVGLDIIIAGDMNASLHRDKGLKRDHNLQRFVQRCGYNIAENYPQSPTFVHHNGSTSQIDYILSKGAIRITNVDIASMAPLNTSMHKAVTANIHLVLHTPSQSIDNKRGGGRVNWNKIDKEEYSERVAKKLDNISWDGQLDGKTLLKGISKSLKEAVEEIQPTTNTQNKRKRKLISPAVLDSCNRSKRLHWQIKNFKGTTEELNTLQQQRKKAKKELRQVQRAEKAENRHKIYRDIMEANSDDKQLFFRLIKKQREGKNRKLSKLFVNDVNIQEDDKIREGWAVYFNNLSTAKSDPNFDQQYKVQVDEDIVNIEKIASQHKESCIELNIEIIGETINKMKNGKSPDGDGIMAEHLKFGGTVLLEYLQKLFNTIILEQKIPDQFKNGIITPIYKKQNKPIWDPNSYRRITVASIIGKVFEKLHLSSIEDQLGNDQSRLQRGFTKGTSPLYAALILTEAIAEAQDRKHPLYAAFLDASKAFDVVWHNSMLRKLYEAGLQGVDWVLMKDWYSNMTSQVKWEGELSRPFAEQQGVRQGGIWSPTAYKAFINPILKIFEENALGLRIGSIHVATPTCADDELLLSKDKYELSALTEVQASYANQERYLLSEQKSKIIVFNKKKGEKEDHLDMCTLNGKVIETVDTYTHIGVTRHSKSSTNLDIAIEEAIQTARKTAYSLMGAGFHGINGINPTVGLQLWEIYVKPRLLYGLECLMLRKQDYQKINQYQRRVLKSIMHLPERTANPGIYILSGQLPIEADIDKKYLTQLMNIFRSEGVEKELAWRQLSVKDVKSKSWFIYVSNILRKYNLPSIYDLLENPVPKQKWRGIVKSEVTKYWKSEIQKEAAMKSTLNHLSCTNFQAGKPHFIWQSASIDTLQVKKAGVRANLVAGTYKLQTVVSKFQGGTISSQCRMCNKGEENLQHFILECNSLEETRKKYICPILQILENLELSMFFKTNRYYLLQLLMDPTHSNLPLRIQEQETMASLEANIRNLCYALHCKRSALLDIPAVR